MKKFNDADWTLNERFNMKGNFTYVNHQVYDILGYYPDEVIGVSASKFIHTEDLSKIIEEITRILIRY